MGLQQLRMSSAVGELFLLSKNGKLSGVGWRPWEDAGAHVTDSEEQDVLWSARQQLQEYFSGVRKQFDLPLELHGTRFQQSVWEELRQIPYGETRAYAEIARRIRRERSVRAVGGANARNPIPIIVPCHRVINLDGGIGGYSGGIRLKRRLLQLEGVIC